MSKYYNKYTILLTIPLKNSVLNKKNASHYLYYYEAF